MRPQAHGKFLHVGDQKLWVRGVTYGTFRPDEDGQEYRPGVVDRDFAQMAAHGLNAVRVYTPPPRWMLDTAQEHGLRVMVGLPWEQHVTFLDDRRRAKRIAARVRAGVRACAGHPAVLCYTVGNEIPSPIVRWHGHRPIERFLERLCAEAHEEDPEGLVTYVNYPSTEYLELPFVDLLAFNVYLESKDKLNAYLAKLQNIAGNRPLIMAEIGYDSQRNGRSAQARMLDWQIRAAFAGGCGGAFMFSWTDEWHRGGHDVVDWDFGLTDRKRLPKPALVAVARAFQEVPFPADTRWPKVSVVVCAYNEAHVIRDSLEGLRRVQYPNFEVIVVDDGSRDGTADVVREYPVRLISTENRGLSTARNTGMQAAQGEIVAYLDADARPDPDWLKYLAWTFMKTSHAAVGGPNIAPPGDGEMADCVAQAPGGPSHVLLTDTVAEHIPGCNMAIRKAALEAIGGFDAQFRIAGDDVDVCWRIQQQGWTIGFNPAAVVWHHRRNSSRAYWRQQLNYGRAEALLERKWPEKYNHVGHVTWEGRVYGGGVTRALGRIGRIYHGMWGNAPFQSLYQYPAGLLQSLPLMPEWYLLVATLAAVCALGTFWAPLFAALPAFVVTAGIPLAQALKSANRATFATKPRSRRMHFRLRRITTMLYVIQPVARLYGRLKMGLTPWKRRVEGFRFPCPRTVALWSESWQSADARLRGLEAVLRLGRATVLRGGEFDRWELEVKGGLSGAARLRMATEEHGGGKQLVRVRIWPALPPVGVGVAIALAVLSVGAAFAAQWVAAALLGLMAAGLAVCQSWDCAAAIAVLMREVELSRAGADFGQDRLTAQPTPTPVATMSNGGRVFRPGMERPALRAGSSETYHEPWK